MVNGRVTAEQMEWLLARAEALGGNLSAALRQTIHDARLLERARLDYKAFRHLNPEWATPEHETGESWGWELMLAIPTSDTTDVELREREQREG